MHCTRNANKCYKCFNFWNRHHTLVKVYIFQREISEAFKYATIFLLEDKFKIENAEILTYSVGVSPDSWVRQWVWVHKTRVRVRVHQVRVRVHQVWVRVHWTRVRVRVHCTRVRVQVRVQWVRVPVRVRESNRSQSESGLSLDSWVQQ